MPINIGQGYITSEAQLKYIVNTVLKSILREIAQETAKYLREYLEQNWYDRNITSGLYQRTYQLLDSITQGHVETNRGKHTVAVYFDIQQIVPNFLGGGLWNQHMSFNGEPFTRGLIESIEEGNDSPYSPDYAEEGIHMLKNTAKWLEDELPKIAKRIFKKHYITVKET